nr:hypothetical protein [Tanacetum cinerariifolium]
YQGNAALFIFDTNGLRLDFVAVEVLLHGLAIYEGQNVPIQAVFGGYVEAVGLAVVHHQLRVGHVFYGLLGAIFEGHGFVGAAVDKERRHFDGGQVAAEVGFAPGFCAGRGGAGRGHEGHRLAPIKRSLAYGMTHHAHPVELLTERGQEIGAVLAEVFDDIIKS